MGVGGWQDEILESLTRRDAQEGSYRDIIAQRELFRLWSRMLLTFATERRLAQHALVLKERNKALLKASRSANPAQGNAIEAAYVASLESQISSMREEVSSSYRTQSQNVNRLLSLTDSLREQEDVARNAQETARSLRSELDALAQKQTDAKNALKEKEKVVVNLNDELATLHLEYNQMEKKNEDLRVDNRNLLQRWLDKVATEVSQVNEANAFIVSLFVS